MRRREVSLLCGSSQSWAGGRHCSSCHGPIHSFAPKREFPCGGHSQLWLLSASPCEVVETGNHGSSCHPGSQGDPELHSVFRAEQGACGARCGAGSFLWRRVKRLPGSSLSLCAGTSRSAHRLGHSSEALCFLTPHLGREGPVAVTC